MNKQDNPITMKTNEDHMETIATAIEYYDIKVIDKKNLQHVMVEALTAKDVEYEKRIREAIPEAKKCKYCKVPFNENARSYDGECHCLCKGEGEGNWDDIGHNDCRQQILDNLNLN